MTSSQAVNQAVTWSIDHKKRTISVTANIAVFADRAPERDAQREALAAAPERIKKAIEAVWSGRKYKCNTLIVTVKVRLLKRRPGAADDMMFHEDKALGDESVVKAVRRSGLDLSGVVCPLRLDLASTTLGIPGWASMEVEVHGCADDYEPSSTDPTRLGTIAFTSTVTIRGDYLTRTPSSRGQGRSPGAVHHGMATRRDGVDRRGAHAVHRAGRGARGPRHHEPQRTGQARHHERHAEHAQRDDGDCGGHAMSVRDGISSARSAALVIGATVMVSGTAVALADRPSVDVYPTPSVVAALELLGQPSRVRPLPGDPEIASGLVERAGSCDAVRSAYQAPDAPVPTGATATIVAGNVGVTARFGTSGVVMADGAAATCQYVVPALPTLVVTGAGAPEVATYTNVVCADLLGITLIGADYDGPDGPLFIGQSTADEDGRRVFDGTLGGEPGTAALHLEVVCTPAAPFRA